MCVCLHGALFLKTMTKRQFTVLAFRLFALYFSFNFIERLGSFISASRMEGSTGLILSLFVFAAVLFFVSLLWRKSEWLMKKIFAVPSLQDKAPEISEGEVTVETKVEIIEYYETPLSAESIELVAFGLFGLHEVLNALPEITRELQGYFAEGAYHTFTLDQILPMLFQFGVGLWLLLRPWQLQDWIAKFRNSGEDETSHEDI